MNVRWMINVTLPVTLLLLFGVAHAQQLPKSAAIGSNPPGSLFYALASGLAKVISEASRYRHKSNPMPAPAPLCRSSTAASWT